MNIVEKTARRGDYKEEGAGDLRVEGVLGMRVACQIVQKEKI